MYRVLFILAILFYNHSKAQQGALIGVRTGVADWYHLNLHDKIYLKNAAASSPKTWENELFLRKETRWRVAFEAFCGYYSYHEKTLGYTNSYGVGYYNELSITDRVIDFGIRIQADITNNGLACKAPILQKFRSYLGITVAGLHNNSSYNQALYYDTTDRVVHQSGKRTANFRDYIGLNHSLYYKISKCLALTGTTNINVYPSYYINVQGSYPDAGPMNMRVNFLFGLGYKL